MDIEKELENELDWVERHLKYYTSIEKQMELRALKIKILQALQHYDEKKYNVYTVKLDKFYR